jgi:hypothetical protein
MSSRQSGGGRTLIKHSNSIEMVYLLAKDKLVKEWLNIPVH